MKALVLYDSNFGNTKLIAEEIAKNLGDDVRLSSAKQFDGTDIDNIDLLVIGCPINGWRPTEAILVAINLLKSKLKDGLKYTTFDTRVKLFIHGDAKEHISRILRDAGGKIVFEPRAFYVAGKKGPLYAGEIEKVAKWTATILSRMQ